MEEVQVKFGVVGLRLVVIWVDLEKIGTRPSANIVELMYSIC